MPTSQTPDPLADLPTAPYLMWQVLLARRELGTTGWTFRGTDIASAKELERRGLATWERDPDTGSIVVTLT